MFSPADKGKSLKLVCWWRLDHLYDNIDKTNLYLGVVSNRTNEAASLCIAVFYRYCTTNMCSMFSGSQISTSIFRSFMSHFNQYVVNFRICISYQFCLFLCTFIYTFFQPLYFYLTPPHTPMWLLTMGIRNTSYLTDWTAYFFHKNWITFDVNIVFKSFQAYIILSLLYWF